MKFGICDLEFVFWDLISTFAAQNK